MLSFFQNSFAFNVNFGKKIALYSLIVAYLLNWLLLPIAGLAAPTVTNIAQINSQNRNIPFATQIYRSQAGDTLTKIAQRYNISLAGLKYLNQNRGVNYNWNAPLPMATTLIVPRRPLGSMEARNFDKAIFNASSNTGASRIEREIAGALKSSQNGKNIGQELQRRAFGAAGSMVNENIAKWLNQYGSVRMRVNVIDGMRFGDSYIDSLFPLYDNANLMIFSQASVARVKDHTQMNVGFGNRYFIPGAMFGVNGFFDYDFSGQHARMGVGADFWRDYMRFAINGYFAISSWRSSAFVNNNIYYKERAANGFDIRGEAYLPFYPQIGFKGVFEQYFGDNVALFSNKHFVKNPFGISFAINYQPIPLIGFDFAYKHHKGRHSAQIGANITYRLGVDFAEQINSDRVSYIRSLAGSRYDFVDRNNNIILDYKKDEPVILKQISGFSGQSFALIESAALGKDWKLKAWHNPDNLALSKECQQESQLAKCRVRLPEYRAARAVRADVRPPNIYHLELVLFHNKTQQERRYQTNVEVKYNDDARDNFTLAFHSNEILTAEPSAQLAIFDKAEIGSNWQMGSWQWRKAEDSDWQEAPKDLLSQECFDVASLAECKITFPAIASEEKQNYKVKINFSNERLDAFEEREAQFTVNPQELIRKANYNITQAENSEAQLFEEFVASSAWGQPSWEAEEFQKAGGHFSDACHDIASLKDCKVVLPPYNKDSETHNRYKLNLRLERTINDKKRHDKESFIIKVTPQHYPVVVTLSSSKILVDHNETLPISLKISERDAPVDISEKDITRYVKLYIDPASIKEGMSTMPLVIGPIKKDKGDYSFDVKAGTNNQKVTIWAQYGEDNKASCTIDIDDGLDLNTKLAVSRRQIMPKSAAGNIETISYSAVKKSNGSKIPSDKLKIAFEYRDHKPADSSFEIGKVVSKDGEQEVTFQALNTGEYTIVLYYEGATDGKSHAIARRQITVFDGRPSGQSQLKIADEKIGYNASVNYPHEVAVSFEARDNDGKPLNYNELVSDISKMQKIEAIFTHNKSGQKVTVPLSYGKSGNVFSFKESGENFIKRFNPKQIGAFTIEVSYGGAVLDKIKQQFEIWPEYALPAKAEITPKKAKLYLDKKESQDITMVYRDQFGFIYDGNRASNIKYKIHKNNSEMAKAEMDKIFTIRNEKDKQVATFTPQDYGKYFIKSYYEDYKNPQKTTDLAMAQIRVYRDFVDEGRKASITVTPPNLTASGDLSADSSVKSEICFIAKSEQDEMMDWLTDLKAIIAKDDIREEVILSPKAGQPGHYCGDTYLMNDYHIKKAGSYAVSINYKGLDWPSLSQSMNVIIPDKIADYDQVKIESPYSNFVIKEVGGVEVEVAYEAKFHDGQFIDPNKLELKLTDRSGADVDAATMAAKTIDGNKAKVKIMAVKKGDYQLRLYQQGESGKIYFIGFKNISFIDALPGPKSGYELLDCKHAPGYPQCTMGPNALGGFPDTIKLEFTAYDDKGAAIDYAQLPIDMAEFTKKLELRFRLTQGQGLSYGLRGNLTYDKGNKFTYIHPASGLLTTAGVFKDAPSLFATGAFMADFYFNDKMLTTKEVEVRNVIWITAGYGKPEGATVTYSYPAKPEEEVEKSQNVTGPISLEKGSAVDIAFSFQVTSVWHPYYRGRSGYPTYRFYKDNVEIPDDGSILQRNEDMARICAQKRAECEVWRFTAKEAGTYKIVPIYTGFQNPPKQYELDFAIVTINVK